MSLEAGFVGLEEEKTGKIYLQKVKPPGFWARLGAKLRPVIVGLLWFFLGVLVGGLII